MKKVFKKEPYLSDIVARGFFFAALIFSYYYFPSYILNNLIFLFIFIFAAGVWFLLVMLDLIAFWKPTSIIISDGGIAEEYRGGGWSYSWSEIDHWYALIHGEGEREIKFTVGGREHSLPTDIINKDRYRELKSIFFKYCGEPTKVDSWMILNDTDVE